MTGKILSGLNEAQREAVHTVEGPVLILAGAGSGKTRTLTYRIAYLVYEKGIPPYHILAITFTNKAAVEMKERVHRLVGGVANQIWIHTFHAVCVRILRREIPHLGYRRDFVIYDTVDQSSLVKDCLKELNLDPQRYAPKGILAAISRAKNELMTPRMVAKRAEDLYDEILARVYQVYQRRLLENNALDFDDLIMQTVLLFRKNPEILDYYQDRFRYLHIDEYQDTNHAQYVFARLLAAKHRNICAVGDDFQSIYGFRGADLRNILDFEKDYPEARVIKLEQNYRSTKTILTAANEIMKHNQGQKFKELWTENEEGPPISYYEAEDEVEEAEFVAAEVRRLKREEKLALSEIAVFYRTHAQSRVLEEVLLRERIPYHIVGGLKFYERKEVKDILAYLRVVHNPADTLSLERIINTPRRGIGIRTLTRVKEYARRQALDLYDALKLAAAGQIGQIKEKSRQGVRSFVTLIEQLREIKDACPVDDLVRMVNEKSGYLAMLRKENTYEALSRMENIQELVSVAKDFEERQQVTGAAGPGEGGLEAFLESVALVSEADNVDTGAGAVLLMTLHSAKGLEFPAVFIVGLEEGVFPHREAVFEASELEEERRLCYVGITRAKRHLYLVRAFQRTLYGNTVYNGISRFIEEIPRELLREVERGDEAAVSGFQTPAPAGGFKAGDRVSHKVWGVGTVVGTRGIGPEAEITVAFPGVGLKRLLVSIAPLEKLQ